ncbi:MAG: chorismate lyase [Magnetococcales bacterium]|nr:chorismate lyase [Magnetococcales bacterium]
MSHPFLPQLIKGWLPPDLFFQQFGTPDSPRLHDALRCTSSLTRYLERQTQQTVRVRLAGQSPIVDAAGDAILWTGQQNLPAADAILVRDAWLLLADQAWIFAHSQVTVDHLAAEARAAIERGEEPLGSLFLEREGQVERTDLELALAEVPALASHLGHATGQRYWCRRSLFRVNQSIRARIFEIFLPVLFA